ENRRIDDRLHIRLGDEQTSSHISIIHKESKSQNKRPRRPGSSSKESGRRRDFPTSGMGSI
ncbi:MAG: hypothetical protein IK104_11125, partial [Clostridia bacterium]|nr:hypothetical protein [Clostridia bacterium]